jgi:hypothetical protein
LALPACQGELGFQQRSVGCLLGCQWLFELRQHAGRVFSAARTQIGVYCSEEVLIAVGTGVLCRQGLIHPGGARLITLTRERIRGVDRRRPLATWIEARTTSQGDYRRGQYDEPDNPSSWVHLLQWPWVFRAGP